MNNLSTALLAAAGNSSSGGGGSANAWDLDYATADVNTALNFDVSNSIVREILGFSGTDAGPRGLFFKPDGTKLFVCGDSNDRVYQMSLTTAWSFNEVGSATYFQLTSGQLNPQGIYIKPDGTMMWTIASNNDQINAYELSTAWDVTTATFDDSFSVSSQESNPRDLWFKPDGTKVYVTGQGGDEINEYDLSTAWDISTISFNQNQSVAAEDTSPQGLWFNSDGTGMWLTGSAKDRIAEFSLSTAWDISTLTDESNVFVTGVVNPQSIFFKPDGSEFYITKTGSPASICQYHVSIKRFSTAGQETNPRSIFFKTDGTKMYIAGSAGDDVNEYNLSTAWDVTTATYSQVGSVSAQEGIVEGIYFKDDGTKMYVTGSSGDDVNEYSLSTAWDVSTLSYVRNFSVATQDASPRGVEFKTDGTKMYIAGGANKAVHEYSLSTAWNISTASFSQSFDASADVTNSGEVRFKSDGTKMFIADRSTAFDGVHEYALNTAWDVSTAFHSKKFKVAENSPEGLAWKPDGTMMYVIGNTSDTVLQYAVG